MRMIHLEPVEVRSKVKLTDPLCKLCPEYEDELMRLREEGRLPHPYLLQDGETYLVINGNHRTRIAGKHAQTMTYWVVENADDLVTVQERDDRDGLPLTIKKARDCLRKAATEHNEQWEWDYDW